ncbi:MAG TPA: MFS transporter [Sphingobium sp.]|uniref:MFS transporter n=1 Tax=Sphingobium sp. TaxID=1912891 RepID=UPI002ED2856D
MTPADEQDDPQRALRAIDGWRGWLLIAVMLSGPSLMALTFSTIAPVLPMISAHFRDQAGSTMLAQWIMTTPAIGLMLGAPIGGWSIDRIGPRAMTIAALAGFAGGGSAGLWADHPATLLASRFVMGFSGAYLATAATWLIGARYDEIGRRRLIAAQDSLAGITAMSAVLLAGIMAQTAGWRAPFMIYLLAVPLLLAAVASIPSIYTSRQATGSTPAELLSHLRPLWPIYLIIVAIAGLMMMPATQVPFLLQANGIEEPIIRSRVIACSALASILAAASFPVVRERAGEAGTFRLILAAYLAGTATLSLATSAEGAALGCFLMGLGTGLFSPSFASLLIARTSPALRGRAIGFMFGAVFLSEFLSPLVILPLRAALGVNGGFGALALLLALALFASFVKRPFATPSIGAAHG